ncbi:MAG: hypothetical protein IPK72_01845 [Candidatus Eisenbacteria bacterium]|nr:hypothetical protein [Candidatus Eisenbacteria bacterium]
MHHRSKILAATLAALLLGPASAGLAAPVDSAPPDSSGTVASPLALRVAVLSGLRATSPEDCARARHHLARLAAVDPELRLCLELGPAEVGAPGDTTLGELCRRLGLEHRGSDATEPLRIAFAELLPLSALAYAESPAVFTPGPETQPHTALDIAQTLAQPTPDGRPQLDRLLDLGGALLIAEGEQGFAHALVSRVDGAELHIFTLAPAPPDSARPETTESHPAAERFHPTDIAPGIRLETIVSSEVRPLIPFLICTLWSDGAIDYELQSIDPEAFGGAHPVLGGRITPREP